MFLWEKKSIYLLRKNTIEKRCNTKKRGDTKNETGQKGFTKRDEQMKESVFTKNEK